MAPLVHFSLSNETNLSLIKSLDENTGNGSFEKNLAFLSGYTLSKVIAERYVRTALDKYNLPIWIIRPGMTTGHSKTGKGNQLDFISRYILGCVSLKAVVDAPRNFQDMTPVDWLAEMVFSLASTVSTLGNVIFFSNPKPISFALFGKWIQECLQEDKQQKIELIPYSKWRPLLNEIASSHPLFPLRPYFPDSEEWPAAPLIQNNLKDVCDEDVHYPEITKDLIFKYIRSLISGK